jgi:Uma2 family endonuclease
VDPDGDTIVVYRRAGNAFEQPVRYTKGQVLTTPLLPDLELPLDRILA